MMTLSGSGCSGLPPPARPTLAARCVPVRGPGGTFVLWVREGGTLELCASLTGSCCLASKAARRALRRCTSAHNAAMSASLSCSESRVRSGKLSMLSLSDTATLLVKRVAPSGGLSNYAQLQHELQALLKAQEAEITRRVKQGTHARHKRDTLVKTASGYTDSLLAKVGKASVEVLPRLIWIYEYDRQGDTDWRTAKREAKRFVRQLQHARATPVVVEAP